MFYNDLSVRALSINILIFEMRLSAQKNLPLLIRAYLSPRLAGLFVCRMEVEDVCSSLSFMTTSIYDILKEAKGYIEKSSVEDFRSNKVGCLGKLIGVYAQKMKSLGISTRAELNEISRKNFSNAVMQECVTDLDQAELEWNEFLADVDKQIQLRVDGVAGNVSGGDMFNLDSPLVDARTDKVVSTQHLRDSQRKVILILLRHFA